MTIEVTLNLPEALIDHARTLGQVTQRNVEAVLTDNLELHFDANPLPLKAIDQLRHPGAIAAHLIQDRLHFSRTLTAPVRSVYRRSPVVGTRWSCSQLGMTD
jgi:hypothetical protein